MVPRKTNLVNDFICANIRRIRIDKGLRVQDIAARAGIPLGSYSCLETGRYRLNLENLFRILHVLGADISQVWPGSVSEAREWVDDRFIRETVRAAKAGRPRNLSLDDIVAAVCEIYGISEKALTSPSRRRDLAEARTVATILTREVRHLSLVSLSRRLKRDVSSLSHCLRRLHDRLSYDRQLRARIREARRALQRRRNRLEAAARARSRYRLRRQQARQDGGQRAN